MTKPVLFRMKLAVAMLSMCPSAVARAQDGAAPGAAPLAPPPASSVWRIDLEYQGADVFDNTVRRPADGDGTRVGIARFGGRAVNTGRVSVYAPLSLFRDGDEIRFIYAPFRQSGSGSTADPVKFDYATFQPGVPLKVLYQFDTCGFRRRRPPIPIASRPPFQFDGGHHSNRIAARLASSRRSILVMS